MGKARHGTSKFASKKRKRSKCLDDRIRRKRSKYVGDRISELPDEIRVNILSLLTMREAARTSVLSSRWKHTWKEFNGSMDFDGSDTLYKIFNSWDKRLLKLERPKYVNWVNQVLDSHKAPTTDEFRIYFDLKICSTSDIDNWIDFALSKGAQRLDVNLRRMLSVPVKGCYCFPSHARVLSGLERLKSLKLNCIDVSGKVLEYILSKLLFLEEFHMHRSTCKGKVIVHGPQHNLKSLEVVCCKNVKYIEISSVNLVSFKYYGRRTPVLQNVPQLAKVTFGSICAGSVIRKSRQLPSYFFQLKKLELDLRSEAFSLPSKLPILRNLRRLILVVDACDCKSLLRYISLVKRCPFLCRFSLSMYWREMKCMLRKTVRRAEESERWKKWIAKEDQFKFLQVVKLEWFAGRETDVEVAEYLLENAPALRKVTVDTRCLYLDRRIMKITKTMSKIEKSERLANARRRAKQLRKKLPAGAKLKVI